MTEPLLHPQSDDDKARILALRLKQAIEAHKAKKAAKQPERTDN